MKKSFEVIFLTLAMMGCQKAPISEDVQDSTSTSRLKAATTVTTEAALKSAVSAAKAGDVITISGTINLTSTLQLLNSGTSSSKINLTGGTLNCAGAGGWGVKVNGSYWNITNIHITKSPSCGIVFQSGGNNYVYNVTADYNGDTGIQVYNGAYNDNVSGCHSNENHDAATQGQNADGFTCKLSGGSGNQFNSCVANHNSDDGWDLYGNPKSVYINKCTSTNNGWDVQGNGNGFKLGSAGQSIPHTCTNCTASYNLACGYDGNGNVGHITITGSTGTGNGKLLFYRIY
jgi:hypothetical protein